eukprot:g977.t1
MLQNPLKTVAMVVAGATVIGFSIALHASIMEDPEDRRARRLKRREKRRNAGCNKEKLVQVLSGISSSVDVIMKKLYTLEQRVRAQSKASGQEIPEMEVRQALLQQFVQMYQQESAKVYKQYNTSEEEVKRVTAKFAAESDVKAHTEKIQKVFAVLSGANDKPVEVPAHITSDTVLQMMEEICKETCDMLDVYVKEIGEEFGITGTAIGMALQSNPGVAAKFQLFHQRSGAVRRRIHKKYQVEDERVLHQFMQNNQGNEEFMREVMRIGAEQHEKMRALGLA